MMKRLFSNTDKFKSKSKFMSKHAQLGFNLVKFIRRSFSIGGINHSPIQTFIQAAKLFVIIIFLTQSNLNAEVRFVSKTGSSTPPYTSWETASDSIQKAINICNDGDTIYVANGIYRETLLIETTVFLIGMSMDSTIIDGTDLNGKEPSFEGCTIYNKASTYLENFSLIGKDSLSRIGTQVVFSENNYLVIRNAKVRNAFRAIGVIFNVALLENIFISNCSFGISINPYLTPGLGSIKNCVILITSNGGTAIDDWRGNTVVENNLIIATNKNILHGISLSLPNTKIIKNNTLLNFYRSNISMDDNLTDSVFIINNNIGYSENNGIWQPGGNDRLKIINNNIFKNRNSVAGNDTNKHRTDYNLFWKNTNDQTANLVMGKNDIIADPMFVKDDTIPSYPINFDFHLQKYSPAIDAGDPSILDADGSRSDIGAFGGPGGHAYQYIDLPPTPPKNFQTSIIPDSNRISIKWDINSESDFNYYKIYKDTVSSFTPDSLTFYSLADTSTFTDYFTNANNVYYKISSVDNQENESIPGETIAVNVVGVNEPKAEIIRNYSLYQNYPNPFNPETKIIYTLKQKSHVKLMVYTILGEMIKVLVNEEKNEGLHESVLRFDNSFSSGIYLYRIEVIGENNIPKFSDMKKMIYMK